MGRKMYVWNIDLIFPFFLDLFSLRTLMVFSALLTCALLLDDKTH